MTIVKLHFLNILHQRTQIWLNFNKLFMVSLQDFLNLFIIYLKGYNPEMFIFNAKGWIQSSGCEFSKVLGSHKVSWRGRGGGVKHVKQGF